MSVPDDPSTPLQPWCEAAAILRRLPARLALPAALLCLAGCGGLYLGDNPGREVRKETGPLTVPPAAVRNGTAQ